jgi:hypothetical protein
LKRLEAKGLGLADAAQGLRRVSNVLGVAMDEIEALEKNHGYLDHSIDELTLRVETLERLRGVPSVAELRGNLKVAKEMREEERNLGKPTGS